MRMFFIYDTAYCKADEDDPKDAVIYFFPTQTYGTQFYSLCCQIVGVAKFFQTTFSTPSLIVLEQEKFVLHWSGKYLFVLGGSLDVHGNILKKHLLFLCGMFCFYHGSINNLMKTCKNDRNEFLAKMELAWSRYITLSQCFNNLLQLSVNALPLSHVKKHSEAVAKSNQLLQMCQLSASVIAGAVFCNSRVLSSQLTPELTSYLTLMSNSNASSPVSNVSFPNKNLPPDVELKYVYLSQSVIKSILRYNHARVGSSVRVKTDEKLYRTQSHYESISSGSEGDVDSGNCTEYVSRKKRSESIVLKTAPSIYELDLITRLLCCSMHSNVLKKDLLKCRNRTFLKNINSEFISEKLKVFQKMASVVHLKGNVKRKRSKSKVGNENIGSGQVPFSNLLCYHHANVFSAGFVSKSTCEHLDLSSACDLEYCCYFCINHQFSYNLTPLSLKNWNSSFEIPDYFQNIPLKPCALEYNLAKEKLKKGKDSRCKIQILTCRTKNDSSAQCRKPHCYHSKRHGENNLFDLKRRTSKHQVYHLSQNLSDIEKFWENVETNNLEKYVLYVQRCGSNMILLLLSKNYDENILTYLWNCGFTFLNDLDYPVEKKVSEKNAVDPMQRIIVYDNVHKVLKEQPHLGVISSEKKVKESIQTIQEDMQCNPKLHMFSLLSANHSIYACQMKQQSAFYFQQDSNTRKLESMCNLSKRAVRRLEKYVKFSP